MDDGYEHVTITWTGGADFTHTFSSSPFKLTVLTVPPNVADKTVGCWILAMAWTASPGNLSGGSGAAAGTLTIGHYDSLSNSLFSNVGQPPACEEFVGPCLFDVDGGTVTIEGIFTDASETISGTVVVAISDVPLENAAEGNAFIPQALTGTSASGTAGVGSINPQFVFTPHELFGTLSIQSSSSALCDFTPGLSWLNLVRRLYSPGLNLSVAIGQYTGDVSTEAVPYSVTYPTPSSPTQPAYLGGSTGGTLIVAYLGDLELAARSRSFGMIIDD